MAELFGETYSDDEQEQLSEYSSQVTHLLLHLLKCLPGTRPVLASAAKIDDTLTFCQALAVNGSCVFVLWNAMLVTVLLRSVNRDVHVTC